MYTYNLHPVDASIISDYQKKIMLGYVVQIATPLNADVDFNLSEQDIVRYGLEDVEYVTYEYVEDGELQTGKAYRTRLEGIANKKDSSLGTERAERTERGSGSKKGSRLVSQALYEVNRLLDRTGGFVKYEITGVDIFRRAIVRLSDPVSGQSINELLLHPKYSSLFKRYIRIS